MAVTKIKPVKGGLKRALDYIQNPDKTDGKLLVSSFGCGYETAYEEFNITLSGARDKGNNLAHHLIQSFEPGESTAEQAHEIGRRLADELTNGRHEYVVTTHIDKGHVHNHLIFCAASFIDHKKYISNKKSYFAIRNFSDKLCKEYGLSVVVPSQNKGKHYAEYAADQAGGSWKSKLKNAIDTLIPESKDFEDLLKRLEAAGHVIKRGKYISIRAEGQERFTRTKTLGVDYTEEAIIKRIAGEYTIAEPTAERDSGTYIKPPMTDNLAIDVQSHVKAQQVAGLARWQKLQNVKEAAKTINFITENKLLSYADLEAKTAEVAAAFDSTADTLKLTEKRLADMAGLMKHITNYQQTKPIADGIKTAKNPDAYRREHESTVILHEAAARALKTHAGESGKLPSSATLQAEYARLTERKDVLHGEYNKLQQEARRYGVVKKNVDSILSVDMERVRGKDRGAEL